MEKDYQVEKILAKKVEKGVLKYLLKWEGYPESDSTWEPAKQLDNIKQMINQFENSQAKNDAKDDSIKKKRREHTPSEDKFVQNKRLKSDSLDKSKATINVDRDSVISLESTKKAEKSSNKKKIEKSDFSEVIESVEGSIEYDIPLKVIDAKISSQKQITCLIEWKPRFDKSKPANSYVPNSALKENFAHLLLDFYESKII